MSDIGINYKYLFSKRGPLKVIAVITLWSFLFTAEGGGFLADNTWAVGMPEERPNVRSIGTGSPGILSEFDVDTFILPQYLGQVKDRHVADSKKIIIHIQDAHCNYAVQKKIADIISYLNNEYDIKMMNLEGGAEDYDLSIFTDIANNDIRKKVTDHFVHEGIISGAEQYAIENPEQIKLWGIEDVSLYLENLSVYINSLTYKEEIDKYLKSLGHVLNDLKRHIYSEELLEFDQTYNEYKSGEIEFKGYFSYLIQQAQEKHININEFPNINNLKEALVSEEKIDFKKANNEKSDLINKLRLMLSKTEVEHLILKTVEFKNELISKNDYYTYILKKAMFVNMSLDEFPELVKFTEYIKLYDSVDKSETSKEMTLLEDEIKDRLYENETQQKLAVISKNFALMKNLFNFSLTRDDYEYYKKNKKAFYVENFTRFIDKEIPKYNITAKPDDSIGNIDQYLKETCEFYGCGFKRDRAFIENIRFKNAEELRVGQEKEAAILVTGGFHAENLCELFKENNISYISIMPFFKTPKNYENPYFNLLAGKETGIQNKLYPIITRIYSIAVANILSTKIAKEVWDKANIDSFRAAVILQRIAEERGWSVNANDITSEGVLFRTPEDTEFMSIRALLWEVHERDIDEPIKQAFEAAKRGEKGKVEVIDAGLRDRAARRIEEIANRLSEESKTILLDLAGRIRSGKREVMRDGGTFEKVDFVHFVDVGDAGFKGHAGGRGIHVNMRNRANAVDIIVHEAIAAVAGDHIAAERAEEGKIDPAVKLLVSGNINAPVWEMTAEERFAIDRDFVKEKVQGIIARHPEKSNIKKVVDAYVRGVLAAFNERGIQLTEEEVRAELQETVDRIKGRKFSIMINLELDQLEQVIETGKYLSFHDLPDQDVSLQGKSFSDIEEYKQFRINTERYMSTFAKKRTSEYPVYGTLVNDNNFGIAGNYGNIALVLDISPEDPGIVYYAGDSLISMEFPKYSFGKEGVLDREAAIIAFAIKMLAAEKNKGYGMDPSGLVLKGLFRLPHGKKIEEIVSMKNEAGENMGGMSFIEAIIFHPVDIKKIKGIKVFGKWSERQEVKELAKSYPWIKVETLSVFDDSDLIQPRKKATEKLLSSVQGKDMLVKTLVGVPAAEESPETVSQTASLFSHVNRELAKNKFGLVEGERIGDKKQILPFSLHVQDPDLTKANIQKAIEITKNLLSKQLHPGEKGHIVIFTPQMEKGRGPQLTLTIQAQFKDDKDITVIPDAYTDFDLKENHFPDIQTRGALARHIAFGRVCELTGNIAGRDAALQAIKDFLRQESGNARLEYIRTIADLMKIENALKIKAIDYQEIVQWAESQKAVDTSL